MKKLLLALLLIGCSTEGVKDSLDVDPTASRGGIGREVDAMLPDAGPQQPDLQPLQPDAKPLTLDTQVLPPDTKVIVVPDTKVDTNPVQEDAKPLTDGVVIVKPDTKVILPDTKPLDVQINVTYLTPVPGDEKVYCMNPMGVKESTVVITDLSKGKCIEIAPIFYMNGKWTQYTCAEFVEKGDCATALIDGCGYCKLSCSRCL